MEKSRIARKLFFIFPFTNNNQNLWLFYCVKLINLSVKFLCHFTDDTDLFTSHCLMVSLVKTCGFLLLEWIKNITSMQVKSNKSSQSSVEEALGAKPRALMIWSVVLRRSETWRWRRKSCGAESWVGFCKTPISPFLTMSRKVEV